MGRGNLFLLAMPAAFAVLVTSARADQVVLTSKAPYWQVGPRDEALTVACALGRFEPDHPAALTARFTGPEGPGVLTVGKGTGINLRDPDRHAKRSEDYYFRNAGTTSCEVFVGGRRGGLKAGR